MSIVVCGCSFLAAVTGHNRGKHFTEIISDHYNRRYVTYARDAISNGGILSQIDTAIDENPYADLFIINSTFNPRIEFPHSPGTKYKFENKLYNFFYDPFKKTKNSYIHNQSSERFNLKKKEIRELNRHTMYSQSVTHTNHVQRLIKELGIPKILPRVIDMYLTYLYDVDWNNQKDVYMFLGMLQKLIHLNKKFLFLPSPDFQKVEILKQFGFIDSPQIVKDKELLPFSYERKGNPELSHISLESHELLAQKLIKYIKDHKLITHTAI